MSQLLPISAVITPKTVKNLNLNWSNNILDHFPFDVIREAQVMGAKAVQQAYDENKKFVIIEAPTGAGKSGIAMMAASYAKTVPSLRGYSAGAYVLSPQKSLTAQYMDDFAKMGLVELKGRSNYTCSDHIVDGQHVDCEVGGMMCGTSEKGNPSGCSYCPYKEAKLAFASSPLGVTNFAYYLNETIHAGQLTPRTMLVLDEGHNTEQQILSMADIVITKRRCDDVGVNFLSIPTVKAGETYKGVAWLSDVFAVAANAFIMKLQGDLEKAKEQEDKPEIATVSKKLSGIQRFMGKIQLFLMSVEQAQNDWIVYTDATKGSDTSGCLIIKPLTAKLFADEFLFSKADKIVILSATIGDFDFFMRNLGIDSKDAVTCRIACDFPVENRPVFLKPVANMSSTKVGCPQCSTPEDSGRENRKGSGCSNCYQSGQVPSIDVAMPKVADFLDKIMSHKNYADKKGIVHTHSYKVTKFMAENLKGDNRTRAVTHSNQKGSRDEAIERHIEAEYATVLFSPSMTEGLDLKDDLSRFSVIVKVPFPYLDPYVKARMQRDPDWYAYCVALALVQATGRSNRHKEDKAHHYILDAAIMSFLSRNGRLLPKWWMDAVVWPS